MQDDMHPNAYHPHFVLMTEHATPKHVPWLS
jgi:hypothetical protein